MRRPRYAPDSSERVGEGDFINDSLRTPGGRGAPVREHSSVIVLPHLPTIRRIAMTLPRTAAELPSLTDTSRLYQQHGEGS